MTRLQTLFDLFKPQPRAKPADLRELEGAQSRLHETTKIVTRETDVFGAVVRKLKGPDPARKKRTVSA